MGSTLLLHTSGIARAIAQAVPRGRAAMSCELRRARDLATRRKRCDGAGFSNTPETLRRQGRWAAGGAHTPHRGFATRYTYLSTRRVAQQSLGRARRSAAEGLSLRSVQRSANRVGAYGT
eukprot:365387-Chlamydomonas_euryale.AAC.21